jgi:4,5-DOPA dioxygenase extradiol
MNLTQPLKDLNKSLPYQGHLMPLLFTGHGSPMNALEENAFVKKWQELGRELPKPAAILCISAHWETRGTFVTAMEKPKTIHDFGGFPQALFEVQYPAPGSPELAKETKSLIRSTSVGFDSQEWGLDHGCWSILKHLYPAADVPVLQLSLDYTKPPRWHYELAGELADLRKKRVLIIGSGNMVHNLRVLNWQMTTGGYDWADEANELFKGSISSGDHQKLINYESLGKPVQLSVPSPEHYLPLLYILGLQQKNEQASFFNDHTLMGSISMTSVKITAA